MKPETVAVLEHEGGFWLPFQKSVSERIRVGPSKVHAIKFEDGSIWDAVNGWRE